MSLSDVIRSNAAALAACQAADFVSALSALESDTTNREDHTLRTSRWIILNLTDQADGQPAGTTEADVVLATLQASNHPRVKAAYAAMAADGIDLADPQTQAMIPILGAGWPAGLSRKVAEAGVKTISVAEDITGEAPTVAAVEAAYNQIEVEDLERQVTNGLNESVNPAISTGDASAVASALRALADAVEV